MPAVEQLVGEAALLVARVAQASSSTTGRPVVTAEAANDGDKGHKDNSNSPLLFFVALGFGVVFTNLWCVSTAPSAWLKHGCVQASSVAWEIV